MADRVLCDPCLFVETEAKACGFCGECIEYLCSGCIYEHRKGKMTRNHRVQEKSMPQNAEIIKAMNEMKICQFHKEMDITYQCNDHGICVCTVCRVDTHRNCKNVFEIAKSEFADQILKDTLESFAEVEKAAEATRKRREDNITRLYHSQDEILREKENIIEQAIQKLEEMKFRYRKETNQKVQAAVSKIEHEIEDVGLIKEKSSRNREILEASLKYNNGSCAHVLAYLLKDEVRTLESSVQKIQQNGLFELTFEGNSESDCITVACLKAVKVQQLDTKNTEHRKAPKAGIEKTSDELLETETSVSRYKAFHSVSTMCNVIDDDVELFCVELLMDRNHSSIFGSVVLPDGKVVLIDFENSSIKLLSSNFNEVLDVLRLPGKPIRICSISSDTVAVSFERVKRINRFTVNGLTLSYDGGFATELYNHGIAFDGSNIVAIMSDVDFSCANNSKEGLIQVEVRNAYNGSVIDVINDFKVIGNRCWSLTLRNTMGICFAKDRSMIIIETNRVLRFVLTKESSNTIAVEQNFYVCSGDIEKFGIQNVTADKDSVYVGTNSGKVLQMFATDFDMNRVILDVGKPIRSITVDNNNNRIIISCEKDENIHVYSFIRSP